MEPTDSGSEHSKGKKAEFDQEIEKKIQQFEAEDRAGGPRSKWVKFLWIVVPALLVMTGGYLTYWFTQLKESSYLQPGSGGVIQSLSSEVKIAQDGKGVPEIQAQSLLDGYRALGWIHARDRLFQMDLIRRQASGKLSEIFGEDLVNIDRLHRWFGFSEVAKKAQDQMSDEVFSELKAYADGVNAFIEKGPITFEMKVIGYQPEPWTPSDSLLVILSLFEQLDFYSQSGSERALTLIQDKRGPEVKKFLSSFTGFLDMPFRADPTENLVPIPPDASVLDIRNENFKVKPIESASLLQTPIVGSNGWVISGEKTRSGLPIVAGDPHLSVSIPNIWYRSKMVTPDLTTSGMTLPGVPGTIIGNNQNIVWTMTNGFADSIDFVRLSPSDGIQTLQDTIEVNGSDPVTFTYEVSPYGPVYQEVNGEKYAMSWVARSPELLAKASPTKINQAKNVRALKAAMGEWTGPLLNFIYGTKSGDIGWQLVGRVPKRVGFDGQTAEVRDQDHYWDGYYSPGEMPQLHNPITSMIVSGNHRKLPVKDSKLEVIPFLNNAASNSRAWRIKELIEKNQKWTAKQMFDVQTDNYSYEISFYKDAFLKAYSNDQALAKMNEDQVKWLDQVNQFVSQWDGRVDLETPAYPLLREMRFQLAATLLEPIAGIEPYDDPLLTGKMFRPVFRWNLITCPIKALLTHQPKNLLSPKYETFDQAVLDSMVVSARNLTNQEYQKLEKLNWGEVNKVAIKHPFALALPSFIGKHFQVPETSYNGDHWTPNVGVTWNGMFHTASMRFATDLQDIQNDSWVEYPGGQSGHFQSDHFLDQYDDWIKNTPKPFEPGKVAVVDILRPSEN